MSQNLVDGIGSMGMHRHIMPAIEGADREFLSYLKKNYPPEPARAGGWRSPFAPR